MSETEVVESITRPDGRVYRPRKVIAYAFASEDDWITGVVVLGTQDVTRARALADRLVLSELGRGYAAVDPETGWWHDGFQGGERIWIHDPVRGRAGVMFRDIVEVAVVIETEWSDSSLDYWPAAAGTSLGEQPHDPEHCHRGGRPHLGPCIDGKDGER